MSRSAVRLSFASAADFRRWLKQNHAKTRALFVLFHRRESGLGGISYPEALDEALCFGWIDGVRKRYDETSYTIRFTPRKPNSIWSAVNVRHAERLVRLGRMRPAGAQAFAARTAQRTGVYSFENKPLALPPDLARLLRQQPRAWTFFQAQPPGYRRTILWWTLSAKQDATRKKRLARLIEESAAQRRLDLMAPQGRDRASDRGGS